MSASVIRPAAVAGAFYPGRPEALRRALYGFLEEAKRRGDRTAAVPKALIVPHAGYVYSGAVAASAYARILPLARRVKRVVLLGPCHRVAVRGLALPEVDAFETPLGSVDIDREALESLSDLPTLAPGRAAHAPDHALEVHLPFLQQALGTFLLVPLLVGDATPEAVTEVLERLWGGDETLIVISSDLSHYLTYDEARRVDRATVDAMLALDDSLNHRQACGATPVNALLQVARRRRMTAELLDLRNSGDTAGDRARVVGYASLAFCEADRTETPTADRDGERGAILTGIARTAIARRLGRAHRIGADAAFLRHAGASFITLTLGERLRGCMGSLLAHRPLGLDVEHNACAAAFSDTRFAALSADEFDRVRVEVSVLSAATVLACESENALLAQLRPHVDGIIFEHGGRRATFLPQVWKSLPDPHEFVAQLKTKAGMARDFWASGVQVSRYTVEKWVEA